MWRRTLTMVRHAGRPDEGRGSLAGQATHIEAWRPATSVKLPPHMCATTPSSFVVVRVRTELAFRRRWHSGALRMIAEHPFPRDDGRLHPPAGPPWRHISRQSSGFDSPWRDGGGAASSGLPSPPSSSSSS